MSHQRANHVHGQPSATGPVTTIGMDRRSVLAGGTAALTAFAGFAAVRRWFLAESVFIAAGQDYAGNLARTILEGLGAVGLDFRWIRGRTVLLKPNMVEPSRLAPHMTTHPALVAAAAEVFQRLGANVTVGEGPGHVRDTEDALLQSGIADIVDADRIPFADLNYEQVRWIPNRGQASHLRGFYFPRSVLQADLIVSLPKLKTHHWVGMTAALKNMYGVLPGICYGWPKNVLHFAGIPQTVVDINASLPKTMAIVDAIECMEGDGPIMGSPKRLGLVVVGMNLTAVDATCARLIGFNPERLPYLRLAGRNLGPLRESWILQRGEPWRPHATPFRVLDRPHLREMGADGGVLIS